MAKLIENPFSGLTYETIAIEERNEESDSSLYEEMESEIEPIRNRPRRDVSTSWSPPKKKRSWNPLPISDRVILEKKEIIPVILSSERIKLSEISPKKIEKALSKVCKQNDKFEFRSLSGGDIIVYPTYPESSTEILNLKKIENLDIKASIPNRLKFKKGIIRNVSSELTKEDIKQELAEIGVCEIRFLCKQMHDKEETVQHRHTVLLELNSQTIPERVYMYHQSYKVVKYKDKPILCKKCFRFGHTVNRCVNEYRCKRCNGSHVTEQCEKDSESVKCINCGKDHDVENPICEKRRISSNIIRGTQNKSTYRDILIGKKHNDDRSSKEKVEYKNKKQSECKQKERREGIAIEFTANPVKEVEKIFLTTKKSIGCQSDVITEEKIVYSRETQCDVEILPRGIAPTHDCMGQTNEKIDESIMEEIYTALFPRLGKVIEYLANRNSAADRAVIRHIMAIASKVQ